MYAYQISVIPTGRAHSRIILSGAFRADAYHELERVFTAEVARGVRFVVVEMSEVTELSSGLFGVFMQTMALLRPMGGRMRFVHPKGLARRVLKLLSMDCEPAIVD